MMQINVTNAENEFTKLVHLLENGEEDSIIITRNGKPIAVMSPFPTDTSRRIGIAKGKFKDPENFDQLDCLDL